MGKKEESDALTDQVCPACRTKNLTLTESQSEVPFFGKLYLFAMHCSHCHYHKADIEAAEQHEPARYTLDVKGKEDLNVRVVRSSEGIIKIPYVGNIEPGPSAEGFITNIEGILVKIKEQVEFLRDSAEEDEDRKKAKNLLKKIQRVLWGEESIKIIVEDPTGNSAIISEKAIRTKL